MKELIFLLINSYLTMVAGLVWIGHLIETRTELSWEWAVATIIFIIGLVFCGIIGEKAEEKRLSK